MFSKIIKLFDKCDDIDKRIESHDFNYGIEVTLRKMSNIKNKIIYFL